MVLPSSVLVIVYLMKLTNVFDVVCCLGFLCTTMYGPQILKHCGTKKHTAMDNDHTTALVCCRKVMHLCKWLLQRNVLLTFFLNFWDTFYWDFIEMSNRNGRVFYQLVSHYK